MSMGAQKTARFQSFAVEAAGAYTAPRLAALRASLKAEGLDGFIIPRADEYQNEYVPAHNERLKWLTGFSGSAGVAIVLAKSAAIFIDGRYTEQVLNEVDVKAFKPVAIMKTAPSAWLVEALSKVKKQNLRIGYDPALHIAAEIERIAARLEGTGAQLVPVLINPIDTLWNAGLGDGAPRPLNAPAPIILHDEVLAGEAASLKMARLAAMLNTQGVDALLISDPHNLAWLLNIRGGDVSHTPLPLARGIFSAKGALQLFIDERKLSKPVAEVLRQNCGIYKEETLPIFLHAECKEAVAQGKPPLKIRLDSMSAAIAFKTLIEEAGGIADVGNDPLTLMKARKNAAEQAGSRAAHLRDGVALTRFLHWFEDAARQGKITEIDCAIALENFRIETGFLHDLSFPTISAAGKNAALPHYRVNEASNRTVEAGLFLIDSGGQYADGTTDVTRTVAVGMPTRAMKNAYTRVLKGMIAVSMAVFPEGTSGAELDPYARAALWQAGLDFAHGTGHGVGSFLSVHEGPQRISKTGSVVLEAGMILSNEPGYYKAGAFGIRIENLVLVETRHIKGGEKPMLGFETLTLAPIDTRPIMKSLMNKQEIAWLNAYHARVRHVLSPLVSADVADWLERATAAI